MNHSIESHKRIEAIADRYEGVVLGCAVGDSLGLVAEGLSRRRSKRLFPGPWRPRLLPGTSWVSDDTEHLLMAAQSLLAHPADPAAFEKRFANCLKGWFLCLPPGLGWATLRACLKLLLGFSPKKSGVFSAGNAPAMRSAVFGAFFRHKPDLLQKYVENATIVTHTDAKALTGALAVAKMAALGMDSTPRNRPSFDLVRELLSSIRPADDDWFRLVKAMEADLAPAKSVEQFADGLGLANGVSGYVYHTVPVALYALLRHWGDFEKTVISVLDLGGDTDTVGAIAGALAGSVSGASQIPRQWISGIRDWPRGTRFMIKTARRLYETAEKNQAKGPVPWFFPAQPLRNLLFLIVVLGHGFRRLLPPY